MTRRGFLAVIVAVAVVRKSPAVERVGPTFQDCVDKFDNQAEFGGIPLVWGGGDRRRLNDHNIVWYGDLAQVMR